LYFKSDQHQHAAEAAILRALTVVAAQAFDRFEAAATATANGVPMWVVLTVRLWLQSIATRRPDPPNPHERAGLGASDFPINHLGIETARSYGYR